MVSNLLILGKGTIYCRVLDEIPTKLLFHVLLVVVLHLPYSKCIIIIIKIQIRGLRDRW